jgi:glycosyltransferase involved in cell wall biosynthesis
MLSTDEIEVSIIMPCFRGEEYIERSIREAENELSKIIDSFEIVIVVDGIVDKTIEIASRLAEEYRNIKVLAYENNRGKGYAIRYGIERVEGKYAFMLDSDLDYNPISLKEFLMIAKETGADIVCGNRRDPRSCFVYPFVRKVSSYIFNIYVNTLFRHLNIPDTQAGTKLFKSEIVKRKLFPEIERYAESNGYIFDVCLLVLARRSHLKITTAPCIFKMRSSTIGVGKKYFITSYKMWKEVLTFKLSIGSL